MTSHVSVIVPCYNEERTIESLLEAIYSQTYPHELTEVVIADGGSTDQTRELIANFSKEHPDLILKLVDNPARIIPAALNTAVDASSYGIILRLDAHSVPEANYIEQAVRVLEETGAANVGGLWNIAPGDNTWVAKSIAVAAGHFLGAGDARYRIHGEAGPVDTVPFGVFDRDWMERAGAFNTDLLTNEDYEYNVRLQKAGGTIWFDPEIQSTYLARSTLTALAKQYARYGFWKAQMLWMYPETIRWRQLLPPVFVGSLGMWLILAIFWRIAVLFLLFQAGIYSLITVAAGVIEAVRRRKTFFTAGFPLAVWTMHFCWGGAFLWGLLVRFLRRKGGKQA